MRLTIASQLVANFERQVDSRQARGGEAQASGWLQEVAVGYLLLRHSRVVAETLAGESRGERARAYDMRHFGPYRPLSVAVSGGILASAGFSAGFTVAGPLSPHYLSAGLDSLAGPGHYVIVWFGTQLACTDLPIGTNRH